MTSNHSIYVITPNIFDIMSTVSFSSPPLYWWYHTNCISEITSAIIHHIISIVYDMTATVWHHNHCINDMRFPTFDITSRVMTSHPLYLWNNRHYICGYMSSLFNIKNTVLRQYSHYIWNHNFHICICVITDTALMIKHTPYLQHGTYYIYGTICTAFDISPTIYDNTTLYPLISLLYLISNWLYLNAHPMYFSHHTQIIDHIAPIVCMITQAQYVWHHLNTCDITSTLYDITRRYDIHTHCVHDITCRIPLITSTVADLLLRVYWL